MNNEQLAQWLRNHPSLTGTDYEEDISKLSGIFFTLITMLVTLTIIMLFYLDGRINGHVFLSLNESRLEHFHVSFGFQFIIMSIIEEMVLIYYYSSVIFLVYVFAYRKAASDLPVVSLQEAVWLLPELHS